MELVSLLEVDRDCVMLVSRCIDCSSPHTLQDLAQLLDSEQSASLDLASIVLVAAQPAPEEKAFYLPKCE